MPFSMPLCPHHFIYLSSQAQLGHIITKKSDTGAGA